MLCAKELSEVVPVVARAETKRKPSGTTANRMVCKSKFAVESAFGAEPRKAKGMGVMITALPQDTPEVEAPIESAVRSFVPSTKPPTEDVLNSLPPADRELLFQLLTLPAEYVEHPDFEKKGAEKQLFGSAAALVSPRATRFREKPTPPPAKPGRKGANTLTTTQEQLTFQRFNFARLSVYRILWAHRGKALNGTQTRLLLAWAHRVFQGREKIVEVNLPLVLAMGKRTRLAGVDFGELVSEGNMALLRSVDKFNCARGFKFSTYACRAILKSFSRVAMRTSRYRGMFPTEFDPTLEKSDQTGLRHEEAESTCVDDLRDILMHNLARLSDVEQTVIRERFALQPGPAAQPVPPKTLEQVGSLIGVTKERVRQIQNKALRKIKHALEESFMAA